MESLITTLEGLGYKVDLQTITVADATIALQVGGAKPLSGDLCIECACHLLSPRHPPAWSWYPSAHPSGALCCPALPSALLLPVLPAPSIHT